MHDNRPAPNGEYPPGGGRRVVPSRAARHAQQAPDGSESWGDHPPWDGGPHTDAWDGFPSGPEGHGPADHRPDGYGQNGYSQNGYGGNGNGYGTNGHGEYGGAPNGHPAGGYPTNGHPSGGYAPYGYGQDGHPANGYASNGYASNGYASNGYAPDASAYPANGHQPHGYQPNGFAPDGYPQNGHHQNGHHNGHREDRRHQNGHHQDGYAPSGHEYGYPSNGYPTNGHTQRGYPQNGHSQNGYAGEGYRPERPPPGGRQRPGPQDGGGRPPSGGRVTPSRAARHAQRQEPPQMRGGDHRDPSARTGRPATGYFPATPQGDERRRDGGPPRGVARPPSARTGDPRDGAPGGRTGTLRPAPAPRRGSSRQEFQGARRPASGRQVTPSRAARHGPPSRSSGRHGRRRQRSFWTELPILIVAAFVLAIGIKGYVVQPFYIPSGSMQPTLQVNDRILVNRLAYRAEAGPEYADVVVFVRRIPNAPPPADGPFAVVRRAVAQGLGNAPPGSEDLIKRVVGRPGDVLQGKEGRLWRNNQPVDESYLPPGTVTSDFGPVTIEPGNLWVMGDNRENSADSRVFGQVSETKLVGQAVILIWPYEHAGTL